MRQTDSRHLPTLIVVAGRPGSGKTTLAPRLARAVRCPMLSRDEIKEGLVVAAGDRTPHVELQRQATETFFDTIALLLNRSITLVVEAAFQHDVWAVRLEPLLGIAHVKIVLYEVEEEVARARREAEALRDPIRAHFHPVADGPTGSVHFDPPRLAVPTLAVDTSAGYLPDIPTIVRFLQE